MYKVPYIKFIYYLRRCVGYQRNAEERRCNVSQPPCEGFYFD